MFVPHSDVDIKKIYEELSINSLSDLFSHLPKDLILESGVDLPEAISELEAIEYFETISQRNTQNLICFAGCLLYTSDAADDTPCEISA